jgi:hypothetical protein
MDKQLLKAYIRTIVEDEVKRVLPEMLSEAVTEIKQLQENSQLPRASSPKAASSTKPKIDRTRLAEMMNLSYDGETLSASTDSIRLPEGTPRDADPKIVQAITKDYSQLMKAMKIV